MQPAFRFILLSLVLALCGAGPVGAGEGWIDVHFHVVGDQGGDAGFTAVADRVIKVMDQSHIDTAIIMSPPRPFASYDVEELRLIQQQYPGRIALLGGGGSLNPMLQEVASRGAAPTPDEMKRFEERAEAILANGAKGFGEMAIHHVSLNPEHGYESIPADHPLLLLLADIAARHDVPIDIHFDPIPEEAERPAALTSPKNPAVFSENITAFERLLVHNPATKIVWAHAGSDPVGFHNPALVRRLMAKHPNLYCSIRTTLNRNQPLYHPKQGINRAWVSLFKDFPDRFMMGTDSFVTTEDYSGPNGPRVFEQKSGAQREGVNEVMGHIGTELARKIGRDNAKRIYHLN